MKNQFLTLALATLVITGTAITSGASVNRKTNSGKSAVPANPVTLACGKQASPGRYAPTAPPTERRNTFRVAERRTGSSNSAL